MQGPKKKKHKNISKSAIPAKRSFKNTRELTPFLPSLVRNIAIPFLSLCLSSMILGCGSGGGGGTTTPTPASLTLEQKIVKARTEALANGCTVVDMNINYSLLPGGENQYGGNIISKQDDKAGAIESVPSGITIKCGDQIYNFVFADEAEQSDNVKKANETPVGNINAFFKTDIKTGDDLEAYIKEKIDLTLLCRFSVYPAFAGTIDDDLTETLTVAVSGKDCETPKWYINDNSDPIIEGNSLVVSLGNLLYGENDITIRVTNPVGTNSLYIKRIQEETANDPATAIKVSVSPTDVYATTASITGSEVVTDIDGGTTLVRKWYKNSVLVASEVSTYTGGQTGGDVITYEVTADGVVTGSASVTVKYSSCTIQFTTCYPSICPILSYYDETAPFTIDAKVNSPDQNLPVVSGDVPAGVIVTPSTNRVTYTGPAAAGSGGNDYTLKAYTSKVKVESCEGTVTINVRGLSLPPPK